MADDLVAAYFTSERLADYRELHWRFPLLCGHWPSEPIVVQSLKFLRGWRMRLAFDDMRSDTKLWRSKSTSWKDLPKNPFFEPVPEPTIDSAPIAEVIDGDVQPPSPTDIPTVFKVALGAIWYIMARWQRELHGPGGSNPVHVAPQREPWEDLWPETVSAILSEPDARLAGVDHRWDVSGIGLWWLYVEAATPGSTNARKQLQAYWEQIGQEAGIIPPSRRGGTKLAVPPALLSDLRDEAEELLTKVRDYSPTAPERTAMSELLRDPPLVAESALWNIAEARAAQAEFHPEKSDEALQQWETAVESDLWCVRLAFPMLTKSELKRAQAGDPREFLWLPAVRLNVREELISEQLARG